MKNNNEKEYWKLKSNLKYEYNDFFKEKQKKILVDLFLKYSKNKKKEDKKNTFLLEAGSGWGYYVRAFSEYNKKVIGLDFEKKMIETSKEICKGIKNIELIQGDVRNLPFKDNYFDYVVSYGVVEHFDETEKAIDEFYRVLKKKGLLFISVPSAYDLTGRLLRQIAILRKKIPYYKQKHYTINCFKKHLKKFKVLNYFGYGYGFGFIPNKLFNISNNILKNNLENLQKKELENISLNQNKIKLSPYFSHMIIFVCEK